MKTSVSRRSFLRQTTACGICLAGNWALAQPAGSADWSIPLLGDLHFDRLEHHDLDWLAREHPNDMRQVENYSRITRERTPQLLEQVRDDTAALRQAGTPAPFVLQLGDLLEGLCGSEHLAQRQAREAIEFVEQARLGVPLLMTKGNHDITGPGAATVYGSFLIPFMAQATKTELTQASFTRTMGGTLLVFYDAYDRQSLDWFAGLLKQHKPRRLVVAIHPPVVPYNARSTWHIYSSPRQEAQRARFLDLLGRHKALVVCGHLHKFSVLVRRTEQGRFVQLAISSVASSSDGRPRDALQGVNDYRPDLVDLEPQHSPETVELRRSLLSAERPFIEHFEYADTWGRAILHLRGGRGSADVFRGFEDECWKHVDLSQPWA